MFNYPLSIGALAKGTGVNIETIRYYERIGLLTPPQRKPSGHRLYDAGQHTKLLFIKQARELGFSITIIRSLLALDPKEDCLAAEKIAKDHLNEIQKKIEALMQLKTALNSIVKDCSEGADRNCSFLEYLNHSHKNNECR